MMHGPAEVRLGRSSAKPANKPGRPGAESVEPRPGAKGNAAAAHAPDAEPG